MIRLLREPIDLAALQASSSADGALCLFAGIVRNQNKGKAVLYLEYEAYEDMALSLMEEIAAEALQKLADHGPAHGASPGPPRASAKRAWRWRWPHRIGPRHSRPAASLIDTLKAQVPIWKKEFYADGSSWLEEARPALREG